MITSLHLRVYKMPKSAFLSIAHRATGVVMFFILLFLAFDISVFIFSAKSSEVANVVNYFEGLRKIFFGKMCIFALIVSSSLNLINGIRYLIIDIFGYGTTKSSVRIFSTITTIVFLLFFSLLLTNLLFLAS